VNSHVRSNASTTVPCTSLAASAAARVGKASRCQERGVPWGSPRGADGEDVAAEFLSFLRDRRTRNAGTRQRRPGSVKGGVRLTPRLLSRDRRPCHDRRAGGEKTGSSQQSATR
jgi:hypothetical protein